MEVVSGMSNIIVINCSVVQELLLQLQDIIIVLLFALLFLLLLYHFIVG